jgi:hypothetical protein
LNRMKEMLQEKIENPQERLERIWHLLRMSDDAKLDMAIKYCDPNYAKNLMNAIDDWEKVTEIIIERETFIYQLENFERIASDPNRYFVKGYRGSSCARLDEAIQRENLYKIIDQIQSKIEPLLKKIEKKHNDIITYNDRPYSDKMKWDRVEMLYYLTEERRLKYFKSEIRVKQLKSNIIEIAS